MTTVDYLIQTELETAKAIVKSDRQKKAKPTQMVSGGRCASAYCNEPMSTKHAPYCSADCRRISQTA